MDSLVEQLKTEREMYEKTRAEQKVTTERRTRAAAVHIQSSFRGYWYDSFCYCY